MATTALEQEIGHGNTGLTPWSAFVDVTETVPELAWPSSINTYSAMRTDAQIASLLLAFTLPIRRYRWYIAPNGARDQVVEDVANDFNLPIEGQDPKPIARRRDRFSHDRHLFHALLMLPYGHCVDQETEALTQRGWVRGDDLEEGDMILTLNAETECSEWQPVEMVHRYPGEHMVRKLEGRSHSSVTTLNHNWITRDHNSKKLRFRKTVELTSGDRILRAAPSSDVPTEPKYTDAFVELMAWYWTEGQEHPGGGAYIHQAQDVNAGFCQRIRAALTSVFGPARPNLYKGHGVGVPGWRESTRTRTTGQVSTEFYINTEGARLIRELAPDRVVDPGFIASLTAAQLHLFIETSIDGDGTRSIRRDRTTIAQKNPKMLDAFEMACSLAGIPWTRTRHLHPATADRAEWVRYVTHLGRAQTDIRPVYAARRSDGRMTDTYEVIDGGVWCPQVQNRTWLARRRGTVYFTGNSYFEQVYRFDESSSRFRLRKLAPRMPGTISEIQIARDGGLEYIRQYPSGQSGFGAKTSLVGLQSPKIPVDRLVAYVNDQEGGNWIGTSYLRPLFKHFVRKDRLLRVDAINAERNGAGVPLAYAPPGNATKDQMEALAALARSYRAGESAGGALPNGADLRFRGVEGTLPDVLASLRYDDEMMAARFMAQFSRLGVTETGSRALGQTLVDFFALAQEAVAKHYADVTNEHVIEDLIDVNYGVDEPAPLLKFETEIDKRYAVTDLAALVKVGALTPDPELEAYLRAEGDLPEYVEDEEPELELDEDDGDKITPIRPAARKGATSKATEPRAAMTVGGRTLRRNPLPHEVRAAVDWDAMEQAWTAQQASLVDDWKTQVKTAHIDALVQAVEEAETLDQLASLEAPVLGQELLGDAMFAMAEEAGAQAVAEAAAQSVELDPFDSELVADEIAVRASAQATVMARSISQTASQKAIALGGSGLAMEEIAGRVREHLDGLSDSYLEDQLGGALMQAQNSARRTVFGNGPAASYYSSELLDGNTCLNCRDVDGKEYESLDDTIEDYPSGGFSRCLGGSRCRGTVVAVYGETPPSVQ
jgi:hypothetical protein